MIAVIGAGAMGSALAILHARAGVPTSLLGTRFDDASIEACRAGRAHPTLGITLPSRIDYHLYEEWTTSEDRGRDVLPTAERIVVGVSSDGLADVVGEVGKHARPEVVWVLATKGWDPATLRTPSEVVAAVMGEGARVVVLAGPALAPELVSAAPTAMVCASSDLNVAGEVATTIGAGGVFATTTDDVAGVEVAAAYKNVTAIAVGMCEGLSDRLPENVFAHRFANARAAVFALGLRDMDRLAGARGGRTSTTLGLAGAGDLYVTCLGGRNGNLGRLLGAGQTLEQATLTIGSTVEGVTNTQAALAHADRLGIDLPTARAVDAVLSGQMSPESAITDALTSLSTA